MIFNIRKRFQLKFRDRESAGNILGESLKEVIKKEEIENSLILGIPRGGVITADKVARKLNCQFNIIIPRKLRAPHNEELAIGAIMGDGTTYLNEILVNGLEINSDYIHNEKLFQMQEIHRRASLYSQKSGSNGCDNLSLEGKTVILTDDGAATGATIIATIRYIRSSARVRRIITAIPIAPKDTVRLLISEGIDHIEVVTSPDNSSFNSIEQYYHNFDQITDDKVIQILKGSVR